MYGQQPGAYAPPPRRPPGRRESLLWLVAATLVLIAAVVIIEVVLTSGGGTTQADRSTSPSTHPVSTGSSSSPSPAGSAPTTDVLPSNVESALCGLSVKPSFVAVAVVTVVSEVTSGGTPDAYAKGVLADCTSPAVRSRISALYGQQFGVDYSNDLTGGHDAGPTAAYTVMNSTGNATLRLDLTRQHDGHYEVTDYTYS